MYYIYLIYCITKKTLKSSYYTGITNDWNNRWKKHVLGKGAKYTRGKILMLGMVVETCSNRSEAQKNEAKVKKLSYQEKQELFQLKLMFDPDELEDGRMARIRSDVIPPTPEEINKVDEEVYQGFLKNKKRT